MMKRIFYLLFIILFSRLVFVAQNRVLDSLIQIVENQNTPDTIKLKLSGDISWELLANDIERSLYFAQKELELSVKTARQADIAQSESDLGNIYNRKSQFDTALVHYKKALQLRLKLAQEEKAAGIYSNMASVLMRQNKFKEALDMDFKALRCFEQVSNISKQAVVLGNIGNIYNELDQNQQAESFFRKGLELSRQAGNAVMEGNILTNLGDMMLEYYEKDHQKINTLDSAFYYYSNAELVFIKANASYNLGGVYNNLGNALNLKKDYKQALIYFEKGLKNRQQVSDQYGIGLSYHSLGETYTYLGDYSKAIIYYQNSVSIFTGLKNYFSLKQTFARLSELYQSKNDLPNTLKYLKLYAQYKDSVYTEDNAKQMAEMQTKYETEKKELENRELKDLNQIKALEIEQEKQKGFIKNLIIISIIILLILGSLSAYSFYHKKQIQQKAELDAEIARQKEIRVKAVIDAEEKERRRIAQDLHDGVGQLLSAAKLNLSHLEDKIKTETPEQKEALNHAIQLVDDSVKEVRTVSHNMMPNTLIKLGLASAVREFITKMGHLPNLKIDLEMIGMDSRLEPQTETVLYRVIQEVINNIIKHAGANHVGIQLIRHENEISVMIEDNGVGFDTKKINEFDGIGLKGIFSRIEFLNGTVHFDSVSGRGTTVIIEIPVS